MIPSYIGSKVELLLATCHRGGVLHAPASMGNGGERLPGNDVLGALGR